MDHQQRVALISSIIARAPQWIRHDLGSKDLSLRERAEESLAAMIAAALVEDDGPHQAIS